MVAAPTPDADRCAGDHRRHPPAGVTPRAAQGRLLTAEVESTWHQVTPQPLRFVGCNVANEVIAYARDRPRSLPLRFFHGDIR